MRLLLLSILSTQESSGDDGAMAALALVAGGFFLLVVIAWIAKAIFAGALAQIFIQAAVGPLVWLLALGGAWDLYLSSNDVSLIGFYSSKLSNGMHWSVVAVFACLVINGLFFIKWMAFGAHSSEGQVELRFKPLNLIGLNMLLGPALVVLSEAFGV